MNNDEIVRLAQRRHDLHKEHPSHRPLSKDYEEIGFACEFALAAYFGAAVDKTDRPGGDGGRDIWLWLRNRQGKVVACKCDVKGAAKPINLIVETVKLVPDTIYVLAGFSYRSRRARLLGWEMGSFIADSTPRDFGGGFLDYHRHVADLRDMIQLKERQAR